MKLREVKERQRVDETLGVRREGRKEGRQQGTKEQVGEGTCTETRRGNYGESKGREVEVKLTREGEVNRMASREIELRERNDRKRKSCFM